MEYIILTNNPLLKNHHDALFFNGNSKDILTTARDLIHNGQKLLTHPLGASLRMLFSPYKSIILSKKSFKLDINSLIIIESSILKYNQHMEVRKEDQANKNDYSFIDLTLLNSAIGELSNFY